uniref:Exocyst subunit Exo70 family protein n=2 Tax=Cajanus cajan TaxID=3821 RepID=A0A151U0T7_CAJCA|nr:Exocyst complex component 7 [Cajanus cajan]
MDALPSEKIKDLEETIMLMVSNGFEKECCDEYCNWRRESLEECLTSLFGLQEINIEQEHEGKKLEEFVIGRWIKVVKVAFRILFPSERRLSDRIFVGFSSVADLCFTEVCRGAVIQLLNLADAVASGSPSEWRLNKITDMFETLCDLTPELQSLFPESLVKEVMTVNDKLGEASRDILMKMENKFFRNSEAKVIAPTDGWVYPLTIYVMDSIAFLHRKRQILEQILVQYPKLTTGAGTSSVSYQIDRIMKRFEKKLEAMSQSYKDPALRYFTMMNNWTWIELYAKNSGFDLDCFRKSTKIIKKNRELYLSSWDMVLEFLKLEKNEIVEPNANVESLKDKLKLFNKHFSNTCATQSKWVSFDKQLREQIIISLQNILLPPYGNFIGRFHDILGNHAYEYIKYGMFDIQDQLNHLFRGSTPMKQYFEAKPRERLLQHV